MQGDLIVPVVGDVEYHSSKSLKLVPYILNCPNRHPINNALYDLYNKKG